MLFIIHYISIISFLTYIYISHIEHDSSLICVLYYSSTISVFHLPYFHVMTALKELALHASSLLNHSAYRSYFSSCSIAHSTVLISIPHAPSLHRALLYSQQHTLKSNRINPMLELTIALSSLGSDTCRGEEIEKSIKGLSLEANLSQNRKPMHFGPNVLIPLSSFIFFRVRFFISYITSQ